MCSQSPKTIVAPNAMHLSPQQRKGIKEIGWEEDQFIERKTHDDLCDSRVFCSQVNPEKVARRETQKEEVSSVGHTKIFTSLMATVNLTWKEGKILAQRPPNVSAFRASRRATFSGFVGEWHSRGGLEREEE